MSKYKNGKYVYKVNRIYEKNTHGNFLCFFLTSALLIFISLTATLALAAPTTPNDNWKIVFDAGIDAPSNYSTSFIPKVWLYNQGGSLVTGATLTCSYVNVNGGITNPSCSVTNNGDGSYSGSSINMQTFAGKYIEVLFSVSAGSYIIREQHVFYAGASNAAHGALWKIQVFNTSVGPSWNGNNQQKIYMKLLSDAGLPYLNNFNTPTIAINGGTPQSMNYEEDGVYSYTISGYANGEYYFEIYNRWSGQPTGGKTRYTEAYAGIYLEANNAQGDESPPEIVTVERKPYFPVDDDYVNITAHAVDNANLVTRTLYYSVNNQTVQIKPMGALSSIEYGATLDPYLLEDNVKYRIEVSDGTNTISSGWYMYNVQDHRGVANMSHSFLNHPAYWFGKTRQPNFADQGGDPSYSGTWSSSTPDGVVMLANDNDYAYFKDMTQIKVQTLIMDETGKPVQHLTNVKAWLSNNTSQPLGTHNREKIMTEMPGQSGVYIATWDGSPNVSGTNYIWSNDSKAIWGKYSSGEEYSVYIDVNNDSLPEENITWLAYNLGDTFWQSAENGKTFGAHNTLETRGSCTRSCHVMGGTTRTTGEPSCPDCHGVYKGANVAWPVNTGTASNKDQIVYGNSTSHPRIYGNSTAINTNASYCGDDTCHNVAWGATQVPSPVTIPGYDSTTRINGTFNAQYPNPMQCSEHHSYKSGKIPVEEGHNRMIACKYCHGGSHSNNKLIDYNTSEQGANLSDINKGTPGYVGSGGINGSGTYSGDCYKDCHKVQVNHSLTGMPGGASQNKAVPCDECHQNFNNAPMHQESVFPYPDRETCSSCHQQPGTGNISSHTSITLNPPRIPSTLLHAQATGTMWNNTGTRSYWVENEQSCRFCHGRSYNEAYGLGRVRNFMETNIINGNINSTSYWCASCHIGNASETRYNYDAMVSVYSLFGVVPPEITNNSTWKSDRTGYVDHNATGKIDKSDPSTYSDDRCFNCHSGSVSQSAGMDAWQHNVSSATINVTDTTPPVQVTGLVNDTITETAADIHWIPNSESDLWGYEVFRNDTHIAFTRKAYYNDSGLTSGILYQYKVRANDSYGNWGQNSSILEVTTTQITPPPNYTWPIVPPPVNQSLGIYDTRVDQYTESMCRNCHNSSYLGGVYTRHHNLINGSQINPTNGQLFSCQDCHPPTPGVGDGMLIDRNCIDCHNGTAFWGNSIGANVNITRPHHINTSYDDAGIGEPAQTRQCNVCHGSFVANYNDSHYIPSYNTSFMITPYADFKAYNATSGRYWGGCYACHQNSSSASPVVMTQHDTHHGAISGWSRDGGIEHQKDATPGRVCTWCHLLLDPHNATVNITINGTQETVLELRNSTLMATDITNGTFEPGTTMPINGTACEKCHSVQSIHNIQAVNNGQPGKGHIGNNSDCNGCHASWVAGAAPLQGAIIPSVDSITPSVVLAGSANAITITGLNFVNDAYTSMVSVDGITYTPKSITDKQIVVNIPALSAGVHTAQLMKGDAKSKLATLTVVTRTTVASAKLAQGSITITGANFGPQPDPAFSDLGVFITHTVKDKLATFRATVISWSDTSIVVDAGTAVVNDQLTVKDLNGQASTTVTKGK